MTFDIYYQWFSRIIEQEVINILKQPGLLLEWDPSVKAVSKVTMATNQDVISVYFNCNSFIARTVLHIREIFGGEINAVYSRQVVFKVYSL